MSYTREQFNSDLSKFYISFDFVKSLLDKYFKNPKDNWDIFTTNIHHALYCYDENNELKMRNSISKKNMGIVAYAFKKAMDMDRKEKAEALRLAKLSEFANKSDYYGNVGDKFKGNPIKLTLMSCPSFETQFSYTYIWNMRDDEGRNFVWFSSSCPSGMVAQLARKIRWDDELDEDYRNKEVARLGKIESNIDSNVPVSFTIIGGSIKEHKEYTDRNGIVTKQTVITRCKVEF